MEFRINQSCPVVFYWLSILNRRIFADKQIACYSFSYQGLGGFFTFDSFEARLGIYQTLYTIVRKEKRKKSLVKIRQCQADKAQQLGRLLKS